VASIVGKRVAGRTYYYLVESARVEGKPRVVSQQYLGSAEEIAARMNETRPGGAVRTQHRAFGDVAAVWEVLRRLDVIGIVDAVVPRYRNAAASVGMYLALATLNRVVAPCSKLGFAEWWATTAGSRWIRLAPAALDHRRFWDAMDLVSEADLRLIETRISPGIRTWCGLPQSARSGCVSGRYGMGAALSE
jgi:hypothetical protein